MKKFQINKVFERAIYYNLYYLIYYIFYIKKVICWKLAFEFKNSNLFKTSGTIKTEDTDNI